MKALARLTFAAVAVFAAFAVQAQAQVHPNLVRLAVGQTYTANDAYMIVICNVGQKPPAGFIKQQKVRCTDVGLASQDGKKIIPVNG